MCYATDFTYSNHVDVKPHKYRTYVNFTTAKYALHAGKFKVDEMAEERRIAGGSVKRESGVVVKGRENLITKLTHDAGEKEKEKEDVDVDPRIRAWKTFGEDEEKAQGDSEVSEASTSTAHSDSDAPKVTNDIATPFDLLDDCVATANTQLEVSFDDVETAVEEKKDPFKVHSTLCE